MVCFGGRNSWGKIGISRTQDNNSKTIWFCLDRVSVKTIPFGGGCGCGSESRGAETWAKRDFAFRKRASRSRISCSMSWMVGVPVMSHTNHKEDEEGEHCDGEKVLVLQFC